MRTRELPPVFSFSLVPMQVIVRREAYKCAVRIILFLDVGCAVILHGAVARAAEPYQLIQEIPIGGEGGWDILEKVDSAAHRVYVSHAPK